MDDTHLKLLAEASLEVTAAEEAIDEQAFQTARDALERAEQQLVELRSGWPGMATAERTIVGATATPLKVRMDTAAKKIPKRTTVTEVAGEPDPEEEIEPAA